MQTPRMKSTSSPTGKWLAIAFLILLLLGALQILLEVPLLGLLRDLFMLKYLPHLGSDSGYGLVFLFGLLTSVHCVGMCGGIALSQSVKREEKTGNAAKGSSVLLPSLLYNGGRILSYTLVGFIVGGLGQAISLTGAWRGVVPIAGGLFMILMAVNLLGVFPVLKRITPRMPAYFARKLHNANRTGPLITGLLTGLMPCGPLQMMQIYALGSKSMVYGAVSLFVFSLGTLPLMFVMGAVSSFLTKKRSAVILRVSAALVLCLGIVMLDRGLALTGVGTPLAGTGGHSGGKNQLTAIIENGVQKVTGSAGTDSFPSIVVQKGIPVEFVLKMDEKHFNDCNKALTIPKLAIDRDLAVGDNTITFTPVEAGTILYTCWMGMIKSTITVVDSLEPAFTAGSGRGNPGAGAATPSAAAAITLHSIEFDTQAGTRR